MNLYYEYVKENFAYYIHNDIGIFEITGEDRVDFLQGQSTNDIKQINDENIITTVLTTANARIIDVLKIIELKDSLLCISLPGHGKSTIDFLKSKIFFMDKVVIKDLSNIYSIIDLEGPKSDKFLMKLGLQIPELDMKIIESYENNTIIIGGQRGLVSKVAFFLLHKIDKQKVILKLLKDYGAEKLNEETREIFRVEGKTPGPISELTNKFTPLENKLDWTISNTKGCYTGQEIIARQINYDKITKNLVKIKLEEMVDLHSKILADGKKLGTVTSIIKSPKNGVIALAFLKRPFFEIGTEIYVEKHGKSIFGEVIT